MNKTPLLDALLGERCAVCGTRVRHRDHAQHHALALLTSGAAPEVTTQKLVALIPNLSEKMGKAKVVFEDQQAGPADDLADTLKAMQHMNVAIEAALCAPPAPAPMMMLASGSVNYGNTAGGGGNLNQGWQQVFGNGGYVNGGWEPQGVTVGAQGITYGGGAVGAQVVERAVRAESKPVEPKVEPEPGVRQIDLED